MDNLHSVIIGSGFSGLCMAINLKKSGIENFVICEKSDDVGGTWRDNNYPGVACDVPSHLYSYSFEPYPDWSKWYGTGEEIHNYIRHCAKKYDVSKHIVFNCKVEKVQWQNRRWEVETSRGDKLNADFVITAMGGLHTPNIPSIKGIEKFKNPLFHTSQWRHDVELEGQRVGVIGTGATTVQCVPEIAKKAKQLFVFQRSPVWVGPKSDPEYTEEEKNAFRQDPILLKKHRWELWRNWETTGLDMVKAGSDINTLSERRARDLIDRSISDPELANRLTPDYNFTCKRPTFSNTYYAAFEQANVELITGPLDSITEQSVVSCGREIELDVLVMATGFKPFNITNEVTLTGIDGKSLADLWQDKITSYKSIMVSGLPNFFIMLGPNSGGLTSTLQMIEQQAKYIIEAISVMKKQGIAAINPKQQKVDEFSRRVQLATAKTTHNKGCSSWWADRDGYNHSIWPESSITYKKMLKRFDQTDFDCSYIKKVLPQAGRLNDV
jgi:cation diffusion facilitator CzcD-associated flavoprotein CzcO